MAVKKVVVEGFQALVDTVVPMESSGKKVFVLFCASKDERTGQSWCPDCVAYEPNVTKVMETLTSADDLEYVYCLVGGRDEWKDMSNKFRTDPRLKLTGVPTLMKWGNPAVKMVEDQLADAEMITEMVEEG